MSEEKKAPVTTSKVGEDMHDCNRRNSGCHLSYRFASVLASRSESISNALFALPRKKVLSQPTGSLITIKDKNNRVLYATRADGIKGALAAAALYRVHLPGAKFPKLKLSAFAADQIHLNDADFSECDFDDVHFIHCDLRHVNFSKRSLRSDASASLKTSQASRLFSRQTTQDG